jgi:hypothetical protein
VIPNEFGLLWSRSIADDDDDAMGGDEVGAAAGALDEDVHAAAPMARLAAIPDTASRRTFFIPAGS